jgi:hypothetical protein
MRIQDREKIMIKKNISGGRIGAKEGEDLTYYDKRNYLKKLPIPPRTIFIR